MKKVTMVLAVLFATLATGTLADDAGLESRVQALESSMPNLTAGLYVNG